MNKSIVAAPSILLAYVLLTACGQAPDDAGKNTSQPTVADNSPLVVRTVNYPLQYFAQQIGGELVNATYPGPDNEDPAYWQPSIETIVDYQQADLIVLNGIGYASWLRQVSLPLRSQVDTSTAFSDQLLPVSNKVAHTHGPQGEHVHDDMAFTAWLDPELARLQAVAIHAALQARLPGETDALAANLLTLSNSLQALNTQLAEAFSLRNGRPVIYSHPVYQYLDRRYEVNGLSLHWEPDSMPPADEFAKLEAMSGALMIWEAEPLPKVAERLAEMNIDITVFATGSTPPAAGDYLQLMQANANQLADALSQP